MSAKKNRKHVTSIDVARYAGVSQSVVSRSFTPGASVAAATRRKVLAAAQELGYQPNAIARGLVTQQSQLIGIVMSDSGNPFYPQVVMRLAEELQASGQQTLLLGLRDDQDPEALEDMVLRALRYQVEALIAVAITLSSTLVRALAQHRIPLLLFNRYVQEAGVLAVTCDNVAGGRLAADALLAAGHRRLAFIGGTPNSSTNRDRLQGFILRLAEAGLSPLHTRSQAYSYDWGRAAVRQMFSAETPTTQQPDALFCANDIIAMGALDALRLELGKKVPEDVSVIGFDDIPAASWLAYDLATVRLPVDTMIDTTVALLKARQGPEVPASPEPIIKFIPGTLLHRATLRPTCTQ